MSHIPALSRLLLETDIGQNLDGNTFFYLYIKLLKFLIHKDKVSPQLLESQFCYFTNNRLQINDIFDPKKDQDAQEFFISIINKVASKCSSFEYVKHHLFALYLDTRTTRPDYGHYSTSRDVNQILILIFEYPKSKSSETETLEGMFLHSINISNLDNYNCPECKLKPGDCVTNRVFYEYPRVLVIQLNIFYQSRLTSPI